MAARILDGKELAKTRQARLAAEVAELNTAGIRPRIASIKVQGDAASDFYVKNQAKLADKLGIPYDLVELPNDVSDSQLSAKIVSLNKDKTISGIMLQVPLPKHLNEEHFHHMIVPIKNIEGMHPENLGELLRGGDGLVPCTARAAIELMLANNIEIKGRHAVVLGRSRIVGKPVAIMLLNRDATVTVCHSRTKDMAAHTRNADILVSAMGAKPGVVGAGMIKPGAVVVDIATIAKSGGGITGDVDYGPASEVAGAITPVPGGVGPVTVAMLMRNAIIAAREQAARTGG